MDNAKVEALVVRIHERSTSGNLRWESTYDPNEFQIAFPEYTVRICRDESSRHLFKIYGSDGRLIESVSESDVGPLLRAREILKEIFLSARRQALGLEKAVDDILSRIK